jgi:hypothetical protein
MGLSIRAQPLGVPVMSTPCAIIFIAAYAVICWEKRINSL